MFRNYLIVAVRNLLRQKSSSFINIVGLSLAFASCGLIGLYIEDEFNVNRQHRNLDRIYRLTNTVQREDDVRTISVVAAPIGPALRAEFPSIVNVVRLLPPYEEALVTHGSASFYEKDLYYADASLFEMFDFPLIRGKAESALSGKNSVVISEALAMKYFGGGDPMGRTLTIDRGVKEFQVSGVMKPIPENSDIRPELIIPFDNLHPQQLKNWLMFSYPTYVQLAEGAAVSDIESALPAFIGRHYGDAPEGFPTITLGLQPLADVHLNPETPAQKNDLGAMAYIYGFLALGLAILCVASVNYMNLATARSRHRALEVGLRKTIGGRSSQLIAQFLTESLVLSLVAAVFAIGLIELFLPSFNELAGKDLDFHLSRHWEGFIAFFVLSAAVGIVAGSYPAFYLSRFQPAVVLKGLSDGAGSGSRLRRMLVVSQFFVSIVLMCSTFVVMVQTEYIHSKNLGFRQDQVIVVPLRGEDSRNNWKRLRDRLLQYPEFVQATAASSIPGNKDWWITAARSEEVSDEQQVYSCAVDEAFFSTLGMELAAGRFLSNDFAGDSANSFVINERAVKEFGWESAETAVGRSFVWLGYGPDRPKSGTIVGVVKNFHFRPLYEEIAPAVFHFEQGGARSFLVRVQPGDIDRSIALLSKTWSAFEPRYPFEYSFLDERVAAQYGVEDRMVRLLGVASAFAVTISCLGLFGLVSYTIERRTKEMGIRKVLGASMVNVFMLVSGEFARFILLAFSLSVPVAVLVSTRFLELYAYRVELSPVSFVIAGVGALAVAFLTIAGHVAKAARANPVESLRYE